MPNEDPEANSRGGTKVWTLSQIPYENNNTPPDRRSELAAGLVD
jgi:hypothetical protein